MIAGRPGTVYSHLGELAVSSAPQDPIPTLRMHRTRSYRRMHSTRSLERGEDIYLGDYSGSQTHAYKPCADASHGRIPLPLARVRKSVSGFPIRVGSPPAPEDGNLP